MVEGCLEIAAVCVGLIGLIGAAAATGMPMWKVTAFIGENIIVMETRWEGLWMNCYRQANIRMQCKIYDSLLFLPPDLQAARGLMCCSLALSGLGLLVALVGMRCTSCIQDNHRAKNIVLMVAGGMQFVACFCVFIPVSWTAHVIIADFYNPLLIDAQRRELGEALYIGWVTGAFLFASAMLFLCRRVPSEGSFDVYHQNNLVGYRREPSRDYQMRYHPISSIYSHGYVGQQLGTQWQNTHPPQVMTNGEVFINPPIVYDSGRPGDASVAYQGGVPRHSTMRSSSNVGSLWMPDGSFHSSQNTTPYSQAHVFDPNVSYQSSFYPVPHTPVFIGYERSTILQKSQRGSGAGEYI
ncbi:claudin-8-like isoform 1-T2 [Spinachia spinachia]